MVTALPARSAIIVTSSAMVKVSSTPMLVGRASSESTRQRTARTRSLTYTKERTMQPPPNTSMLPPSGAWAILRHSAAGAFSRPPRQAPLGPWQFRTTPTNLLRLGFETSDFEHDGSDRLVDAIVAWGDLDAIARRIQEHHAGGADHLCIQVIAPEMHLLPYETWKVLAEALCQ
jgi:hypothetical protein